MLHWKLSCPPPPPPPAAFVTRGHNLFINGTRTSQTSLRPPLAPIAFLLRVIGNVKKRTRNQYSRRGVMDCKMKFFRVIKKGERIQQNSFGK